MNALLQKILAATHLTRRGDLVAATAAIQEALGGGGAIAPVAPASVMTPFASERALATITGETLLKQPVAAPEPAVSGSGRFIAGRYSGVQGERGFKLFAPDGVDSRRVPLVVMLHGCQQDPDDFAAGTRMNERGAAEDLYVLYPAQAPRSNAQRCWNWFQPGDQRRGGGEPALLAAMVQQVMAEHPIDADRVFVAGLSAGAAMAAILAREYPDLFAAAGVHSGLPPGAAHDVASAFAAMQSGLARAPAWPGIVAGGGLAPMTAWPRAAMPTDRDGTTDDLAEADEGAPLIVFHGDADTTVHATNGSHVVDAGLGKADWLVSRDNPAPSGRRRSTRTVYLRHGGAPSRAEHWVVHGAGHAWAGGSAGGSFTDPDGPDATREMLRFFAEHPRMPSRVASDKSND